MKKTTFAALVISLAAGSAFAAAPVTNTVAPAPAGHGPVAGEHRGPGGHMFEDSDTNHDGVLSKEEWTAKGDKLFNDMDANHDGKLTKEEMKAHFDMERAKHEQERLQNGSGIKTPATNSAPKN